MHVPNAVSDSICANTLGAQCLYKRFPTGYGMVKFMSTDMISDARLDNLNWHATNVTIEIGIKWVPMKVLGLRATAFFLQYHIVPDSNDAYDIPASKAPTFRWLAYSMPLAGHFLPPPELHTHSSLPSTVWIIRRHFYDELMPMLKLYSASGKLAIVNLTLAHIQSQMYAKGDVRCRIISRAVRISAVGYLRRHPLYDRRCDSALRNWHFHRGDQMILIAFNVPTKSDFRQHQDVKLFTVFQSGGL